MIWMINVNLQEFTMVQSDTYISKNMVNPLKTDKPLLHSSRYQITPHVVQGNVSSIFFRRSEANASELLKNLEETFIR